MSLSDRHIVITGASSGIGRATAEVLTVNLRSPFWAVRHVLPAMIARGSGAILMTGSLAPERGMAGNASYIVAKHGLRGLAMAMPDHTNPALRTFTGHVR
jgi:NAD(P)-dependent dehydrogenase (short-subunit alcohol dehydrogenase family)